jgi:hypothetical protein
MYGTNFNLYAVALDNAPDEMFVTLNPVTSFVDPTEVTPSGK